MSDEENKKVAHKYHDLNPDDVETILTPDFIGHGSDGFSWNRDSHQNFWLTVHGQLKDIIHEQLAGGDLVSTRFTRTGQYEGKQVNWEMMHIMRFANDRIAEIWECFNSK